VSAKTGVPLSSPFTNVMGENREDRLCRGVKNWMMSRFSAISSNARAILKSHGIIGNSALWLMLFNREATDTTVSLKHTTLATARMRFLFIAAKIWRHSGRTGVSFSDHYEEKGLFRRLMERLRAIRPRGDSFGSVVENALA
jgi:hypothetical protein